MSNISCVMITGTSRGLGAALAQSYLDSGEQVIGCSRGVPTIFHPNYRHYSLDLSDENLIIKMVTDMRDMKLVPRLLVNNAALTLSQLSAYTSAQSVRDIINVNLVGTFLICREILKIMQRHRFGRIVNLSSVNVPLARAGSSIYNASKAGLVEMGNSLASECKTYDITVNSIGLSFVAETGMINESTQTAIDSVQRLLLKPKLLSTAEIVAAIDFFASRESRNITCQTLYFGGVR